MGCCCLSDSTIHNHSRSISNERVGADPPNRISAYKTTIEQPISNNKESLSQINFETIPHFAEFTQSFEDFIGRMNRNYKQNKPRLLEFLKKWSDLLKKIQKTLSEPTENKLKDLFNTRLLVVNRKCKYKENKEQSNKQQVPLNSNSIIEEKNEYEEGLELDLKENSSQENSFHKNQELKTEKFGDFNNLNKEKFIILIQKAKFLENSDNIDLPFIQIKIKEDQFQNNKERITIFETKKAEKKIIPEWNEYFCKEFEFGKKLNLNNAVFIVELLYFNTKSQLLNSLGENTFTFDEIRNQIVNQKIIKYTKFDKIIAELFIKCQVIYDYKSLLKYWEDSIKVKKEIANRLIIKSQQNHNEIEFDEDKIKNDNNFKLNSEDEERKKSENLKENSILSMDEQQSMAQSGYFENPYYVKN